MDVGLVILIMGLTALVAAFLLLVIGLVYSELVNSDIPRGIASCGKLHMVHALFVGIAVVVSVYWTLWDCLCYRSRFLCVILWYL